MTQKCTAQQSEEQLLLKSFKFFDFKNSGEVDFGAF
jgi:Ca2+-binding EF-hand superfamily protein